MKAIITSSFLCFLCLILSVGHLKAQVNPADLRNLDSTSIIKVSLKDGSVFAGILISKSAVEIVLSNSITGKVTIPMDQIKSVTIKEEGKTAGLSKWLPNPNPTRYFFGPSAFNLKKGEGYYQNVYVDVSMFGYGVTDWFSIGGGLEVIGTLASLTQGGFSPIWIITPKIGFPVAKNWHVGAGFMGGILGGSGLFNSSHIGWGITYGVVTYGNVDNNLTLGVGMPMSTQGKFINPPIIVINGMRRVSQKVSLISENWIFTGNAGSNFIGFNSLLGYGIRLSGETMSFDLGFINNLQIAKLLIIGVPYIDIVYRFGKR